jgi:ATP-dependent RNA helicase DeaD
MTQSLQTASQVLEPENPLRPYKLDDLSSGMRKAAARMGWPSLSPVQSYAMPYFKAGRDMMVQARTGSGKTGAFILPLIDEIDFGMKECQALVLVPTRELAQQVSEEAKALAGDSGLHVVPVYGGASYKPQIDGFKAGAHLVVGTPGRILDHLLKRNLILKNLKALIFDEADRMMSMGFYPDMKRVQSYIPAGQVKTYMFSATYPSGVTRLGQQFMKEPGFLSLSRDQVHVEDTEHIYYIVPRMDRDRAMARIIEMENPGQAIIFCNTRDRVHFVTRVLQRFGYNADQLSSDLSQNKREKVLGRLRDGKLRFLVATDVASRGIDIPQLSHVFQYEPPQDIEDYIHRAGRTGRAGESGVAALILNAMEKKHITRLSAHYKIEFKERPVPDHEDVEELVAERLVNQLESRLRDRDKLQVERMQRFLPLVKELANDEEGIALLAMLLDDTYHKWMHNPPEIPPVTGESSNKSDRGGNRKSSNRGKRRRS